MRWHDRLVCREVDAREVSLLATRSNVYMEAICGPVLSPYYGIVQRFKSFRSESN